MGSSSRIVIIDLLRSLAIVCMVLYHVAFDLTTFRGIPIDLSQLSWETLRIFTASLFIGIAGFTTHLTREPTLRAGKILLAALLVTVVTYIGDPETFIRFGILHCIGFSVLLLAFLRPLNAGNIALGILVSSTGILLGTPIVDTAFLLPLGFVPPLFTTLDYYPLLPWMGAAMIGYGLGFLLLPKLRITNHESRTIQFLSWPGKHSLAIYLLHQPLIVATLLLF